MRNVIWYILECQRKKKYHTGSFALTRAQKGKELQDNVNYQLSTTSSEAGAISM